MGFASKWLDERALFPEFIKEAPDENTGIIVVVPAYNEPGIISLLDSLASCKEPPCKAEIIIVINAPADSGKEVLNTNKECLNTIETWREQHTNCFFRTLLINVTDPLPRWGVGSARKTGMDEAVRRFDRIGKPGGVIVSLDADCLVEENYFNSINSELLEKPGCPACSIYFEHPLSGNQFPAVNYSYVTWYELHLRYYLQGMKYAGFPYAFHTVGSAMAVKALAYIRAGGMNRRQAGEDFYFIQKLVPMQGYFSLNSTAVYPAPRISLRVPFGTGATISKLSGDNSGEFLSYNIQAFRDLRLFFNEAEKIYSLSGEETENNYSSLPDSVKKYIQLKEYTSKMNEIRSNTSGKQAFRKRFFAWFNMFRIVKYMNAVHQEFYRKIPVNEAASELLEILGIHSPSRDAFNLLKTYRELEKNEKN